MAKRDVVIYTTMFCSYCHSALMLLKKKGVEFQEIPVDGDRAARQAMSERAGGATSVPQIFIGDAPIGGRDELYALEASGELDALLHESVG